jgi:hypothetical protein
MTGIPAPSAISPVRPVGRPMSAVHLRGLAVGLLIVGLATACSSSASLHLRVNGNGGGASNESVPVPPVSNSSGSLPAASLPPGGSGGGLATSCPSAAEVRAATGLALPLTDHQTGGETTICSYNAVTAGENLVATITNNKSTTAGVFHTVMSAQASALHVTESALRGLGQAAYIFTEKDASTNADHVATTTLGVYTNGSFMILNGTLATSKIEAVAKLLVH